MAYVPFSVYAVQLRNADARKKVSGRQIVYVILIFLNHLHMKLGFIAVSGRSDSKIRQ